MTSAFVCPLISAVRELLAAVQESGVDKAATAAAAAAGKAARAVEQAAAPEQQAPSATATQTAA